MAAVFFHQVQGQVNARVIPARTKQAAFVGDQSLQLEVYLRVALFELFRKTPVGGGRLAIQQPGFRQNKYAGTYGCDVGALAMHRF